MLDGGRARRARPATRSPPSLGPRRRRCRDPPSPGSSCSATSPADSSACYSRDAADPRPVPRIALGWRHGIGSASPPCLSIAGSDSGGGAGIQADLKAFARCGVHGMTAITALTAQNTVGVEAVEAVAPEMIVAQVRAVAEDIGVDAVKIGMLGTAETDRRRGRGARPGRRGAGGRRPGDGRRERRRAARRGGPRRRWSSGCCRWPPWSPRTCPRRGRCPGPGSDDPRRSSPARCLALGPRAVVVTGGHSEQRRRPLLRRPASRPRSPARATGGAAHGSGCTHSSALAAFLARGDGPLRRRAGRAQIASEAVGHGLREIGAGPARWTSRPSLNGCPVRTANRSASPVDFRA